MPIILRVIAARIRELFSRSTVAFDQDDEFRFHLEMQTAENLRRGMSPEDARRAARIAFGGEQKYSEATRDRRGFALLDGAVREVIFTARRLRRRPGLVAAVVVTLALAIGASTAVFSLIDAVLLRPIAVPDAERLVRIGSGGAGQFGGNTYAAYEEYARDASTLSGAAAYTGGTVDLRTGDDRDDLSAEFVTDNYFSLLHVRPALGRVFSPAESPYPGANPVVVLSAALWRSRFNADSSVIGRIITLRHVPLTIIGVMPDRFNGTDLSYPPDVWLPTSLIPTLQMPLLAYQGSINPQIPLFQVIGRLRRSADSASVAADLRRLQGRAEVADAARRSSGAATSVAVVPLVHAAAGIVSRESVVRIVRLLVGVVGLILLLACLNIANLFLLRAHERARELGVRMALGAGAVQIVLQLVIESLMLALLGGLAGIGVGRVAMRAMSGFALPGNIQLARVAMGLNGRVLVAALAMTLLTAAICGLVPGIHAARGKAADVLRGRETGGGAGRRRMAVLSLQVALSLVLLVGGTLLLRSVQAGFSRGIGFDPHPIAAVSLAPKFDGRRLDTLREYASVVAALEGHSGVSAAAASTQVPLTRVFARPFAAGDVPAQGTTDARTVGIATSHISKDFFSVLGVPVLRGRAFGDQDGPDAPPVIILNESAARALWPGASPLGKVVHAPFFGPIVHAYTVVGVVRDTKYGSLEDDRVPFAYLPLGQEDLMGAAITFVARSRDPRGLLSVMPRIVTEAAPDMKLASGNSPTTRPRLVSDQIAVALAPQRFGAALIASLALLALSVSAVGIHGTVSYSVSRRTAEIGIRKALGAEAGRVVALVVRQTAVAVAAGGAAGLIGAALCTRLLRGLLFGVGPLDVISFATATAVIAGVATCAALVPSVRATRIDPVRAIQTLG